ncbi:MULTISPECIES: hypothetical protein [unclassified Nocardiopsis]|uniref:hypothetical protein n=1 Tax=unclassified Nocardiopsis TaxID=2649073 RepID=UPI00135C817E|nr:MULTISPECIES: hypothetical protein [unclassified Nocardiopsis]
MTVVGAGTRIASGGALHAALILLMPFRVSSDVSPVLAFTALSGMYVGFLAVTTLPGMLAFLLENRGEAGTESLSSAWAKLTPSAVAGLLYFLLPASLMLTEEFLFATFAFSAFFLFFGALLHRVCLEVSFSPAARPVLRSVALLVPVLLVLARAWPL